MVAEVVSVMACVSVAGVAEAAVPRLAFAEAAAAVPGLLVLAV